MSIPKDIIDRTLATPQGTGAYRIAEKLLDAGHEAWWVGGCVRDMLLGNIPSDIDIATSAVPDEVTKLFQKTDDASAGLGAILVSLEGHVFEVTTYREEHELSDGRYPESVTFTDRESDAKRRDITINAIYWNPISSEIYDPFEGQKDLSEKLIRIIGDPKTRIEHDALRLLRVVRFRAKIDGQYHPDTFKALHENAKMIEILSGTRRLEELEKMLLGPHPDRALEDLWELDIIEYVIPELHACKGVAQPGKFHQEGDVWDHMMKILRSFTEEHALDVRLAALFHDCGKVKTFALKERIRFDEHASISGDITKEVLDRLQCPARRRDKIVWLVRHHMMMLSFFDMSDERKAHWYYHPWFPELLQIFRLDIVGSEPPDYELYERIVADYNHFLDTHPRPPKRLLTGEEVMEILGIQPGEKVGEALKLLHEAQIRKEVNTKDEAREFLRKLKLVSSE